MDKLHQVLTCVSVFFRFNNSLLFLFLCVHAFASNIVLLCVVLLIFFVLMYFYVLWILVGFLLSFYDSNYRTNEFFCLNNVCQLSIVKYYFGITNGTNLSWGLSNSKNFSLPMAQTFCGVCQILLSDYQWSKPFAYSKCRVCQILPSDYESLRTFAYSKCGVCWILFSDYQWPKPNTKTTVGHIPNWTLNKRIVCNLSPTVICE